MTSPHTDFSRLEAEIPSFGKPAWEPVLHALVDLHRRSLEPAKFGFPYEWEHLGPGYYYGPAFGHFDLIHTIIDSVPAEPEHCRRQILNDLHFQEANGFLPGALWLKTGKVEYYAEGHPPVWPFAVEEYCKITDDDSFKQEVLPNLKNQIRWYELHRMLPSGGFFYLDVCGDRHWESGVDDGVRYTPSPGLVPCVDATSHLYALYDFAYRWSGEEAYHQKAEAVGDFIRQKMFREATGFFHDVSPNFHFSFEGFWPLTCGAATPYQANRAIDEWLLNPEAFFTEHPIPTVAKCDPGFELRMWRGGAFNSMTMWVLKGCLRYGRKDAVAKIAEKVMDAVSLQYERTHKIWEFYHPFLDEQQKMQRKPYNPESNIPCTDYIGHSPLFAIARLWREALA